MNIIRRSSSIGLVAAEDLFLEADGRTLVKAGDPKAAFLLARKGNEIPIGEIRRLGLTEETKLDEPKTVSPDQPQTISPEDAEARSTRPEKPAAKR
jgi:hypothetical protein